MLHRRWGRSVAHPELRPVIVDPLADDADFARALVGRLGEAIVDLVAPRAPAREELAGGAAGGGRAERGRRAAAAAPGPLREGYTLFLRAVGAEWRASPARGRVSLIADAEVRAVRANYGVYGQAFECAGWVEPNRALGLQSAAAMVTEPVLIATVLHRMAASAAGRRVAAAEIYAPFLAEPAPTGVSGGAILGAFRNFQAKLLSAWAHATWRGEPPRDLVDLVDAYIQAFPEDRADVIRIFVVTTYGATVAAGGVPPGAARRDDDDDDDGAAGVARLNALVAAAQEGRLGLRAAIPGTGLAD
jgi:hypothetical protein